jgi:fibronectin-binding autotransporter adhesin
MTFKSFSAFRLALAFVVSFTFTGFSWGQNAYRWVALLPGSTQSQTNWSQQQNWVLLDGDTPATPPNNASHTALFDGTGNGNTSISLVDGPFTINSLRFDTSGAAAYNIGGGGTGTLIFATDVTIAPTLVMNSTVVNNQIISGNITLNGNLSVAQSSTANLTVSGVIANGTAGTSVTKTGTGNLTLSGANTYSGGTTISSGTLQVGSNNNLGNASGGLTFNGGTLATTATMTSARTVSMAGNGTINTNASTTLTLGGAVTGTGLLTKVGTGALAINGTVAGGVSVNAGTLQGTGTLGATTVNGTLSPGNSVGTLTFTGAFTMNSGSTLKIEITTAGAGAAANTGLSTDGGAIHDKLVGNGTATFNPNMNFIIDVTGSAFVNSQSQSYRIMSGAGNQSSLNITDLARFSFIGLAGTGVNTYEAMGVSLTGDALGNVNLNFTPVPEPATMLAVGASVLGVGAMVRRRFNKTLSA